ncbi:MAG: hypothetical protein KI785_09530 [Devosiaceae bacterium]|nr:hypothetical protein [Devosiaceae bacterium MH13]
MPALLGVAALALGGLVLAGLARREWRRVNRAMDDARREPVKAPGERGETLEHDPQSGTYRPRDTETR